MKKLVLFLTIALSVAFGSSAMSLKEAFDALSNVPNISVRADDDNPILGLIVNGRTASAHDLDRAQILESGNAVYGVLDQVPLARMINGGNNNQVCAFVYAASDSLKGIYEVLIVLMSGKDGDITVIYGGIDEAARNALQAAPLKMDYDAISISASLPNGDTFNIRAN